MSSQESTRNDHRRGQTFRHHAVVRRHWPSLGFHIENRFQDHKPWRRVTVTVRTSSQRARRNIRTRQLVTPLKCQPTPDSDAN